MTFAVCGQYITLVLVISSIGKFRKTFAAILGVTSSTNSETSLIMFLTDTEGAVPDDWQDSIFMNQKPDWDMATDLDGDDGQNENHGHDYDVSIVKQLPDDVYREQVNLCSHGVLNTLRFMLIEGMNGQYKTVKERRVHLGYTITCFQEQDVYDQYVFKWYYLMKCVLDLIAYHRKKHYHGLMDRVTWVCPSCKAYIWPHNHRLPRIW